ncbi:MAG: potassium channel protein [Candidatus Schekmanbacteria bacterium]|nr:MAG: potassium channel protein [Candidatus Schekmanbacteria bacterium]
MFFDEELSFSLKRIIQAVLLILLIFVIGTSGYYLLGIFEGKNWRFLECAYMTAITISTVGYGEVIDISHSVFGRVFTVILILSGMGVALYSVSTITAFIVEGDLKRILERRKMINKIKLMENHYIVCGCGITGSGIVKELLLTGRDFVVIEKNIEHIEKAKKMGEFLYILGDSTEDEILLDANIKKARGLITTLPDDKDNLFVTITAKELNPDIRIISKVIEENSAPKLLRAGANSVVSPNAIGSMRMASELVRPHVVNFLDGMLRGKEKHFRIEEFTILEGSRLIGKKLGDSPIYKETDIPVLAIKKLGESEYTYNPPHNMKIEAGMVLIVLTDSNGLRKLSGFN